MAKKADKNEPKMELRGPSPFPPKVDAIMAEARASGSASAKCRDGSDLFVKVDKAGIHVCCAERGALMNPDYPGFPRTDYNDLEFPELQIMALAQDRGGLA